MTPVGIPTCTERCRLVPRINGTKMQIHAQHTPGAHQFITDSSCVFDQRHQDFSSTHRRIPASLTFLLVSQAGFLLLKSVETSSLNMSLLRTLRYPARENQHPTPTPQTDNSCQRRRSTRNRVSQPRPHDCNIFLENRPTWR